jgi:alkylation response protein AidB-like acyl-CoA dehydrogenase
VLELVPAGAVADEVVFFEGQQLRCMEIADHRRAVSNFGSMPVADVTIGAAAVVVRSGDEARNLFEVARDEWLVLTANALVGIGSRSIEIGVNYVKERHAFGVPIGSFQAVAHGLADAATAVDGGRLLAREAAWAADGKPARASVLASLACGFCGEAAREASYRSLHYHGGYGFMLEFDIQLYFRRGRAWPMPFGDPSHIYARGAASQLSTGRAVG